MISRGLEKKLIVGDATVLLSLMKMISQVFIPISMTAIIIKLLVPFVKVRLLLPCDRFRRAMGSNPNQ